MTKADQQYVVHDYSAVNEYVDHLASRNRALVYEIKARNFGSYAKWGAVFVVGLGLAAALVLWGLSLQTRFQIVEKDLIVRELVSFNPTVIVRPNKEVSDFGPRDNPIGPVVKDRAAIVDGSKSTPGKIVKLQEPGATFDDGKPVAKSGVSGLRGGNHSGSPEIIAETAPVQNVSSLDKVLDAATSRTNELRGVEKNGTVGVGDKPQNDEHNNRTGVESGLGKSQMGNVPMDQPDDKLFPREQDVIANTPSKLENIRKSGKPRLDEIEKKNANLKSASGVIPLFSFNIFKRVPYEVGNISSVVIGMRYGDSNKKKPENQWCYITHGNSDGTSTKITLATIRPGSNRRDRELSLPLAKSIGITLTELKAAQKLCLFE
jgi:hypothetical protein